ncbi:hypothetical protein CQW23_27584 [Capsicum baccatum]|uniref:Uncharacterized protein n=1 Tax=Capsicum baccatum TaxID=33114 RepID=A0A2G2VE61_CAPBA|nr:hypothetical protein CQW23_27584 [Capsicum baccatum]
MILIRVNERIFNLPASHGELCFGSSEVWVTSQSAANVPLLSKRTCSSKTTSVRNEAHNKHGNQISKIVLNSCSFLPAFEGSELVVSDHGMTENGNHGGSTFEETDSLALFIGPADFGTGTPNKANQVDLASTLALLFGVPIPMNNVGMLMPETFKSFTALPLQKRLIGKGKYVLDLDDDTEPHIKQGEALKTFCASLQGLSAPLTTWIGESVEPASTIDQQLRLLELNSWQLLRLLQAQLPGLVCENFLCDSFWDDKSERTRGYSSLEENFCCLFMRAADLHRSWKSREEKRSACEDNCHSTVVAYHDFLRTARKQVFSEQNNQFSSVNNDLSRWHLDDIFILVHIVTRTEKNTSATVDSKTNNYIHICSILVILISGRILGGWHQGGVNWTNLPDISKWLEQMGSTYIKLFQLVSVIILINISLVSPIVAAARELNACTISLPTRLDDGAGSSSNPTPIQTRLENFSNPTRVIRLADGGWTLSSRTPMSSLGDGGASTCETIPIVAMKKGRNFLNQMEKIRLDDESGATSSNPTRNTCSDTFWTRCPYCYHMYEFLKDYKGCSLRCPNEKCKREWQALPIIGPSPPPEVADKGEYICSDFSTLGTQGNYLSSQFFKKKDDVEYIEISSSSDEVEEVGNERKEESLRAEDELVQINVDEVNNNNVGVENTIENNYNFLANDDIFDLGNVLWPGEPANENYNNALPNDDFDMDNVLWPGEQANENNNNNAWANDDFDMGNVLWGEQANENNDNIWANDDFDMGNVLWGEQTNENSDNVVANDMGNVLGGEQTNENNNAEGNGNAGGENTQNNNDDESVMGEDLVALFQDGSDKGAQDLDALFR